MTFKDKILIYVYRKLTETEDDYENTIRRLRYSKADEVDYIESLVAKVRKDVITEISADIMAIVGMQDVGQFDSLMKNR